MPTINGAAPTATQREEFEADFSPVLALDASTVLTWPDAGNRPIHMNAAGAVVLTLPNGAGIRVGAQIRGSNIGAGALSFAAGGGESIVGNAVLPDAVAQYDPWLFERVSGNRWLRQA